MRVGERDGSQLGAYGPKRAGAQSYGSVHEEGSLEARGSAQPCAPRPRSPVLLYRLPASLRAT